MTPNKLQTALDRLAALIPNGELKMATDPAALIDEVCDRLTYFQSALLVGHDLLPIGHTHRLKGDE